MRGTTKVMEHPGCGVSAFLSLQPCARAAAPPDVCLSLGGGLTRLRSRMPCLTSVTPPPPTPLRRLGEGCSHSALSSSWISSRSSARVSASSAFSTTANPERFSSCEQRGWGSEFVRCGLLHHSLYPSPPHTLRVGEILARRFSERARMILLCAPTLTLSRLPPTSKRITDLARSTSLIARRISPPGSRKKQKRGGGSRFPGKHGGWRRARG